MNPSARNAFSLYRVSSANEGAANPECQQEITPIPPHGRKSAPTAATLARLQTYCEDFPRDRGRRLPLATGCSGYGPA
jgi:hypothetical protein